MVRSTFVVMVLLAIASRLQGQLPHTSVPLGDTLNKALFASSLTGSGASPFHLKILISEPAHPQPSFTGTVEEWWESDHEWRREISSNGGGLHQLVVTHDGIKTEEDSGDYFPLWLRNFVTAAFDPVPDVASWNASGAPVVQAMFPNGTKSDACVSVKRQLGLADHPVTFFSSICFNVQGSLGSYGSPRYTMEFRDYRNFGSKRYPRTFTVDLDHDTKLVGSVQVLESLGSNLGTLFLPLSRNDNRFRTVTVNPELMQKLTDQVAPIVWPPIHSGRTDGGLTIYISTDSAGRVREAWPLISDNSALEASATEQSQHWILKAAKDKSGAAVQVDGILGLAFSTQIADPLPELSNAEVRQMTKNAVLPIWLPNTVKPGDVFEVQIKVDERGKIIGFGFKNLPPAIQMSIHDALEQWAIPPFTRNGKPQSFIGNVRFAVPTTP